jgi:hypothetical protein
MQCSDPGVFSNKLIAQLRRAVCGAIVDQKNFNVALGDSENSGGTVVQILATVIYRNDNAIFYRHRYSSDKSEIEQHFPELFFC